MNNNLFEFKYKPLTFDDLILNPEVKQVLKKALTERPNLILHGPPGVGKGSFVEVFIKHLQLENCTLKINASLDFSMEDVRSKIKVFAQATNFEMDKKKLIYLNEFDHSAVLAAQKSLRALQEETSHVANWIYCCNYIENVIPELKSRCQVIHLNNPPAKDIYSKCELILKTEGIQYDKKTLIELVKKCYPDIRKTFVFLRQNCNNGKLNETIELSSFDKLFEEILSGILSKDPEKVRKILKSNAINYQSLYGFLYDRIMNSVEDDVFKNDAEAIVLIAEAAYRDATVSIRELNFMGLLFSLLKNGII